MLSLALSFFSFSQSTILEFKLSYLKFMCLFCSSEELYPGLHLKDTKTQITWNFFYLFLIFAIWAFSQVSALVPTPLFLVEFSLATAETDLTRDALLGLLVGKALSSEFPLFAIGFLIEVSPVTLTFLVSDSKHFWPIVVVYGSNWG